MKNTAFMEIRAYNQKGFGEIYICTINALDITRFYPCNFGKNLRTQKMIEGVAVSMRDESRYLQVVGTYQEFKAKLQKALMSAGNLTTPLILELDEK